MDITEYNNTHKEEIKLYKKRYRIKHAAEIKAYNKAYKKSHAAELKPKRNKYWKDHMERYKIVKKNSRLVRYGLTVNDYDKMFAKQNGLCYICHKPESRKVKGSLCRLSIDHDHKTGKVRKLLCSRCNLALGNLNDSLELINTIKLYLEEHRPIEKTITLEELESFLT